MNLDSYIYLRITRGVQASRPHRDRRTKYYLGQFGPFSATRIVEHELRVTAVEMGRAVCSIIVVYRLRRAWKVFGRCGISGMFARWEMAVLRYASNVCPLSSSFANASLLPHNLCTPISQTHNQFTYG